MNDIVERARVRNVPYGWPELADKLADEIERLRHALEEIEAWSRAYPLRVFPEPDFDKAAELLKAGGMTLDSISASNMRHVVEGVGAIARKALRNDDA
jgi:hypothetical protein